MDLLSEAAEIEHSLACQYLFAAFSLKQPGDPGLTPEQGAMVSRWFDRIVHTVATQEMLHLALANNMLTAIGGAPYLVRPNFPQWDKLYSVGLDSVLTPFSVETLERFMCWEKPQWPGPWDAACAARPLMLSVDAQQLATSATEELNPDAYPYSTIAGLYDRIRACFESADEAALFIGNPADQVGESYVPFVPTLHRVTDTASAVAAIDLIVVEGEGTPSPDPTDCHYGWFRDIRDELAAELARDPSFEPAWPCVDNPLFDFHHDNSTPGATMVTVPYTRQVGELFTASYDVLLTILMRLFDADGETDEERRTLAACAVALMRTVITPLGVALARLPAFAADPPSPTAGASFELFRDVQPLPHREPAWTYLRERLGEIADATLAAAAPPDAPDCLSNVADMLRFWAGRLVLDGGAA
ncbi:MAG TPA: ferritin-like domain-containing protein [Mycobacteriales bacterium]|nr:ferritin-like domain-containing protein [Mycobacteriales bacterium]